MKQLALVQSGVQQWIRQVLKVYHLDTEGVLYSTQLPCADLIHKLSWSTRDEHVILAASGSTVGCWAYKSGDWKVLHNFKATIMCMQQSPSQTQLLAVGTADGLLYVYDLVHQKVLVQLRLEEGQVPCDVQFDPLSKQYLLLLCRNGSMTMFALDEEHKLLNQVSSMAKQPAAERSAAFVPNAPGNFVTISNKTGTALYSVTWSPDGSQLAASTGSGAVILFDYAKGIAVKKWTLHSKSALKPDLLVSTSVDGSVVAFKTDGTKIKVLRHAAAVSGCAWHPVAAMQLATTSETGTVYVWDLSQPGDNCLTQTLTGHAKRSFSVAWSPLLQHVLLSGSDDATARVWDVSTGHCLALLSGHRLEVRALCWHPEVPWLLFTGSWDSTIRVWDFRSQACLLVCPDHHGDVYGLSVHSSCPWLLASASRDTTIRLWDVRGLAAGVMTRCFLPGMDGTAAVPRGQSSRLPDGTFGSSCNSSSNGYMVGNLNALGRIKLFQRLSAYFMAPGPAHAMWHLAAAAAANLGAMGPGERVAVGSCSSTVGQPLLPQSAADGSSAAANSKSAGTAQTPSVGGRGSGHGIAPLPASVSFGYQHVLASRAAILSAANQLELGVRGKAGLGKAPIAAAKRDEVLLQASQLQLQAGNVEHCCELMVEVGDWDKAIALAPAVSQQYWCRLLQRHADFLSKQGASSKELLPLMLATGQSSALMQLLMNQKQYDLAADIAAVQACGVKMQMDSKRQFGVCQFYNGVPQPKICSTVMTEAGTPASPLGPSGSPKQSMQAQAQIQHAGGAEDGVAASHLARLNVGRSYSVGSPPTAGADNAQGLQGSLRTASGNFNGLANVVGSLEIKAGLADPSAFQQLLAIRTEQGSDQRLQGRPFLAACAALTVNDVNAAVAALHLGNEPEQAAMMCLAMADLVHIDPGLRDRVFQALSVKCESAGDWEAAAAALNMLSGGAEQQVQLLMVRARRGSLGSCAEVDSRLGQLLGLKEAENVDKVAESMPDPMESVRCLLLAGNHAQAAVKAVMHMQVLLQQTAEALLESSDTTVAQNSIGSLGTDIGSEALQPQQPAKADLLQRPGIDGLLRWQSHVESLDPAVLDSACWQEVFAYALLIGALRAYSYAYVKVGSYLLTCLRHWVEQHQVLFPLDRPSLLMLEAELLVGSNTEAACSLLMAASMSQGAAESASTVSLSEAVMLGHVMRFGPHGTGLKLRLV
eukprot:gene7969-8167_t